MTGQVPELAQKTRPDIIGSVLNTEISDQPAVDFLIHALGDEDKRVRIAAVNAPSGKLVDPERRTTWYPF